MAFAATQSRLACGMCCSTSGQGTPISRLSCPLYTAVQISSKVYSRRTNVALKVSAVATPSGTLQERDTDNRGAVLQETQTFLQSELRSLFKTGNITRMRYSPSYRFEDPVVRYEGIDAFELNLRLLRTLFDITLDVHMVEVTGPSEITSRWTMTLKPRLLSWRPPLTFTGQSIYGVNTFDGKLLYQRDTWDAVQNNSFPSVEGYAHLLGQLSNVQSTPQLETPSYSILKKTGDYEIRQYDPYLVAETNMPVGSGPAAGDGFQTLASYLFGSNSRNVSMEMTTPVVNTVGSGEVAEKMQFVIEKQMGDTPDQLPAPRDTSVVRKIEEGGIVAASIFGGLPLDFEVTTAERRLRAALLLDGLKPLHGYRLARYNDPFTLPAVRRNEILIKLEEFKLE